MKTFDADAALYLKIQKTRVFLLYDRLLYGVQHCLDDEERNFCGCSDIDVIIYIYRYIYSKKRGQLLSGKNRKKRG